MLIQPTVVCSLIALFRIPFGNQSYLEIIELPTDIEDDYIPLVQTVIPIMSYAGADAVIRRLGLMRGVSSDCYINRKAWNVFGGKIRWQFVQSFI